MEAGTSPTSRSFFRWGGWGNSPPQQQHHAAAPPQYQLPQKKPAATRGQLLEIPSSPLGQWFSNSVSSPVSGATNLDMMPEESAPERELCLFIDPMAIPPPSPIDTSCCPPETDKCMPANNCSGIGGWRGEPCPPYLTPPPAQQQQCVPPCSPCPSPCSPSPFPASPAFFFQQPGCMPQDTTSMVDEDSAEPPRREYAFFAEDGNRIGGTPAVMRRMQEERCAAFDDEPAKR